MYIEKRYLRKIAKVFQELSLPLRLLDADGACIVPEDGPGIAVPASTLASGINHHVGDALVRVLDIHPALYLAAQASAPGAGDVLCLADAMVMSLLKSSLSISGYSDVYRKALRQELTGAELAARAAEHKIPLEMNRCVIVFQLDDTDKASAYSTLGELLPLGETDVLVEMNRREAALVKDMEGIDGAAELEQYVLAVQETLMEEAALNMAAGVGESKNNLALLGESYAEAKRAIEVGQLFNPEEHIFLFSRLMLERFLMSVPREDSLRYHSLLFNRKTAVILDDTKNPSFFSASLHRRRQYPKAFRFLAVFIQWIFNGIQAFLRVVMNGKRPSRKKRLFPYQQQVQLILHFHCHGQQPFLAPAKGHQGAAACGLRQTHGA